MCLKVDRELVGGDGESLWTDAKMNVVGVCTLLYRLWDCQAVVCMAEQIISEKFQSRRRSRVGFSREGINNMPKSLLIYLSGEILNLIFGDRSSVVCAEATLFMKHRSGRWAARCLVGRILVHGHWSRHVPAYYSYIHVGSPGQGTYY